MKVRSFNHVGLTVSNFKNAVKWYHEIFGLRLVSEQIIDKAQAEKLYKLYNLTNIEIKLGFLNVPGGGIIEIFEFSSACEPQKVCWNKPGPTHFTLNVKHLSEWHTRLKKKGVEFLCEPQKTAGADWVFLKDPDGNFIEMMDLKTNYHILRWFGDIAGWAMAKGKFKKYYMK